MDAEHARALKHRTRRRVGTLVTVLASLAALVVVGHRAIPDVLGFGSLVDTFLPWIGAPIALLVPVAAFSRTLRATVAVAVAVAAWSALFAPPLLHSGPGGPSDLSVVSHDVLAANPDPAGTVGVLLAAHPDVVVLQELTSGFLQGAGARLDARYPYHAYPGSQPGASVPAVPEFGVWSDVPIENPQLVQVAPGQLDALRVTLQAKDGPVVLYDVQLIGPHLNHNGFAVERNGALAGLDQTLVRDRAPRLIVAGDLNVAATDRRFGPLAHDLTDAQIAAGSGFGFTYPADFPAFAFDHILSRGLTPTDCAVLPSTASDHLPLLARYRFG